MEPPSHQTFVLCGVLVVAGLGCSFCLVLESHAWLCKGISWSPFALLPAKEGLGPLWLFCPLVPFDHSGINVTAPRDRGWWRGFHQACISHQRQHQGAPRLACSASGPVVRTLSTGVPVALGFKAGILPPVTGQVITVPPLILSPGTCRLLSQGWGERDFTISRVSTQPGHSSVYSFSAGEQHSTSKEESTASRQDFWTQRTWNRDFPSCGRYGKGHPGPSGRCRRAVDSANPICFPWERNVGRWFQTL